MNVHGQELNGVKATSSKILMAMYLSVDRMNVHYRLGNHDSVAAEQGLQRNLRQNLEELRKKCHK